MLLSTQDKDQQRGAKGSGQIPCGEGLSQSVFPSERVLSSWTSSRPTECVCYHQQFATKLCPRLACFVGKWGQRQGCQVYILPLDSPPFPGGVRKKGIQAAKPSNFTSFYELLASTKMELNRQVFGVLKVQTTWYYDLAVNNQLYKKTYFSLWEEIVLSSKVS